MAFDATRRRATGAACPSTTRRSSISSSRGKVALDPFVERRPLAAINETFEDIRKRTRVARRVILIAGGLTR